MSKIEDLNLESLQKMQDEDLGIDILIKALENEVILLKRKVAVLENNESIKSNGELTTTVGGSTVVVSEDCIICEVQPIKLYIPLNQKKINDFYETIDLKSYQCLSGQSLPLGR